MWRMRFNPWSRLRRMPRARRRLTARESPTRPLVAGSRPSGMMRTPASSNHQSSQLGFAFSDVKTVQPMEFVPKSNPNYMIFLSRPVIQ